MDYQVMGDRNTQPTIDDILAFIGQSSPTWRDIAAYLEGSFGARPKTEYSVCKGQPGWNVKYKKSGKSLCTLYPVSGAFRTLITLGPRECDHVEQNRDAFCEPFLSKYDSVAPLNGLRWLMFTVDGEDLVRDLKRVMAVKAGR